MKHFYQKGIAIVLSGLLIASLAACGGNTDNTDPTTATATIDEATRPAATSTSNATEATVKKLSEADITINETIENNADSEHAILADGNTASYSNTKVVKTGDSDSGDEADFYGDNAAIFATNGATLDLSEMVVKSDGTHANAVFSYGEGTTVNISDSYIETSGNCSGGLMTTGGGTMNASPPSSTRPPISPYRMPR